MSSSESEQSTESVINVSLFVLLLLIVALSVQLIDTLQSRQTQRSDLAELNSIKYGMLNVDIWVQNLSAIMDKKIREFEFNDQNRDAIKATLERMLDTLIVEADRYMRRQNASGNWWRRTQGRIKQGIQDVFVDIEDIKSAVPEYAERILDELDKPEGRAELHGFLSHMLQQLSAASFAKLDTQQLDVIYHRYECEERQFCHRIVESRLAQLDRQAQALSATLLSLSVVLFLIVGLMQKEASLASQKARLLSLSGCAAALLMCGILSPMIEVEARISSLQFILLQEPVNFLDQVLYFQSKSILNVVQVLANSGTADMIFVAILIMSFSVLFPAAKLLTSLIYIYNWKQLRSKALVQFFALKSGKWSMADVMVVAIFMAYIGFDGLVGSQLSHFAAGDNQNVSVLTTNGTSLQIGFFMFLGFCLASLTASTLTEHCIKQADEQ